MKNKNQILLTAFVCFSALHFQPSTAFAQGSLTPPGAPAPTFKTLDQIEPRTPIATNTTPGNASNLFIITNSGSYYLTANVVGVSAKSGILISNNDVSLDLNGFGLLGVGGSVHGISVSGARTNLVIRNGVVRGWGGNGVGASSANNCVVENLLVSANAADGISAGTNSLVTRCSAIGNASVSGHAGIRVGDGSLVSGCTAYGNNGDSAVGILTGESCTVLNCTASKNNGLSGAGSGIGTRGIHVGPRCLVKDCVAGNNTGTGIRSAGDSVIVGNVCSMNSTNGILATELCLIVGNNCSDNTSNGIHVTDSANHIADNIVHRNGTGIRVGLTNGNSFVIKNFGGPLTIAPGNKNAQLLLPGSGFSSTNAWANFD